MSGDSDTSSDDENAKLRSALDPDFKLFDKGLTTTVTTSNGQGQSSKRREAHQSSEWNAGHFVHPLRLTADSQKFVAKQLDEAIEKNIKMSKKKRIVQNEAVTEADNEGIFLFAASTQRISANDLNHASKKDENKAKGKSKQRAPVIKKRKIDNDSSSEDEDIKLKSVAVSSDWVLNPMSL